MIVWRDYFKGKKITLMGLGLLGRGINDAKFLAEMGAELIVTDLKTAEQLETSLKQLKKYSQIKFVLGEHRLEDFKDRDFILRAANVPLGSIHLAEARKNGIPIKMDASWFAELAPAGVTLIGITGTRGKSTTTQMIYEILTQGHRVFLGGNVKGVATLPLLKKVKTGDILVLELDSWQLQGFGEEQISPQIAVFTNFFPDHLNYYKGDMKQYLADKENIFKYQKAGDTLIRGESVEKLPKSWKLKVLGEHNRVNAACAVAVARALKIPEKMIRKTMENFTGVAGRLELIRTKHGVKYYNDTTATSPEAVIVALQALGDPKKIILIAGGADKNFPEESVANLVNKLLTVKQVILLPGTGTEKVKRQKSKGKSESQKSKFAEVKSLAEAVKVAQNKAKTGDTVILSPGFASFGPPPGGFKNEYDRGAQFNKLIKQLK
ncbi:MAG: Mur ligase family protein [Patescibacteria group bacterium]